MSARTEDLKARNELRMHLRREEMRARGRRLATMSPRTRGKASVQARKEIAEYLAREPTPRFYG